MSEHEKPTSNREQILAWLPIAAAAHPPGERAWLCKSE